MLPPNLSRTDLHLLHVFSVVAEARGFAAAQIELNVAPSTISRQISDLEIRLGMTLCHRGRAGFRLTDKGRLVYRAAQRLFASVREFSETIDGSRGSLTGSLSLAVIDNWVFNDQSAFSAALSRFLDHAPDVTLELFSLAPDDIERAVQDARVSLGIGVFHRQKPGLEYTSLGVEKIDLYCASGHPLYDETRADRTDAGLKQTRYAKRAYLREREVAPVSRGLRATAHAHQIEGIAHLILTGKFVGYLPEQFANVWVRRGLMRSVGQGRFAQPSNLKLVCKRGTKPTRAARTFRTYLQDAAGPPA